MTVCTISQWETRAWTDEIEALARDKYVPLVLAAGAQSVKMIRTGDLTFTIVSEYADAAAAEAAKARIEAVRTQAKEEMPMSMHATATGEVFAASS